MNPQRPFSQLERATVAEQVRDEIIARIVSGELQPGTQLPAERVLAASFGVARTSVREAIQALVALGVIERRGNRSYVTERLPGAEVSPANGRTKAIRDLLAARRILERLLFGLAAVRATARERQKTLELARRPLPADPEELMLLDRQFHAMIAGACANPVLTEVYGRVVEALVTENLPPAMIIGVRGTLDEPETVTRLGREHLVIAEAFAGGDGEALVAAVDAHVGPIEGWIGQGLMGMPRRTPQMPGSGLDRTVGM